MKRYGSTLLALALAGAMITPAFAAAPAPTVQAPGSSVTTQEQKPTRYTIQVDGQDIQADVQVMVSLRAVAEALGFTVTWQDGSILVDNGIVHTTLTVGVDRYQLVTSIEGLVGMSAPFSLGAAPYVQDGVSYVPLNLFHALLGNRKDAITMEGGTIQIHTKSTNKPQIPNPFLDCETMEDAIKLSGFPMTPPQAVDGYSPPHIRAVKGTMIELIFEKGGDEISIRKGAGEGDISGDYATYPQRRAADVDGLYVTMEGENDTVSLATWTHEGYTFAIRATAGLRTGDMIALIQATA